MNIIGQTLGIIDKYLNAGNGVIKIIGNRSGTWTVIDYFKEMQTIYVKGDTQYENVTSINKSEYPTNDKLGEYWYVLIEK